MKKMNKNIFICALLVLMVLLCINTASADDSLNQNLTDAEVTSPVTDDVSVDSLDAQGEDSISSEASNGALGDSGNTLIVDSNGGADYQTISEAVSAASGGETIFIRNGEYSEANTITFTKSLTLIGESQDGVKITGAAKSLFSTVEPALSLSFTNLTILNAGGSSNPAFKATFSAHNISFTNCTFDNCGSKWGTIQFGHPGIGILDNCKILNSKEIISAGCGAIYISNAGKITIKDTIIDNVLYTPTSSYMQGAIYMTNAAAVLNIENTVISNVSAPTRGVIHNNGATVNIINSRIVDNNISKYNTQSSNIICVGNGGKVNIQQSEISNNYCVDEMFSSYSDTSDITVNYCNIQNNDASGITNQRGNFDLECNWWGSNDKPLDSISVNIIEDGGVYKLSNGSDLTKIIPGLNDDEPEEVIIYVGVDGSDENDGLTPETAVATIEKAVELSNGKIIMLEGTYTVSSNLAIDKNLQITGEGAVTINSNSKTISNSAVLTFENILFRNALSASAISNDGTLTLLNCTFTGNIGSVNGIVNSKQGSKLRVDNCVFKENARTGQNPYVCALAINSCEATITNSEISDNSGQNSVPVAIKGDSNVVIDNTTFKNNIYIVGFGGALSISGNSKVEISNSNFISNKRVTPQAAQIPAGGAAIYQSENADVTIDKCIFIDNAAGTLQGAPLSDTGILIGGGKLDVSNSVFINPADNNMPAILVSGSPTVTANQNYWGNNDGPNTAVPVDNWVILTAYYDPDVVQKDDEIIVVGEFNTLMHENGETGEYEGCLPDGIPVSFASSSGNLSEDATTIDGQASVSYTVNTEDSTITVTSAKSTVTLPIKVFESIIYVSPEGSDDNNGSKDAPVKTIARALEISNGKIYVMEGNYTIDATLTIDKDTDIEGLGEVVIDGNSKRIFENTANLVITNIDFKNAVSAMGSLLLDDGNSTLVDCKVYSCSATGSSGNIINNRKGNLTIEQCEFYDCVAKRGVVASQSGTTLNIKYSDFHDNDMVSTYSTNTYGVVYAATAETLIDTTIFRNNRVQKGGAIYANAATGKYTNVIIQNCAFVNNTAEGGEAGAVHASGTVVVKISDSIFANNKATKSSSNVGGRGAAVYVSGTSDVSIDKSVFINNVGADDSGIYVYGSQSSNSKLSVSNSVLLAEEGSSISPLVKADDELASNVVANDNWWGDNAKANTLVPVERWVMAELSYSPENIIAGDEIEITLSFTRYNSTSGVGDLTDFIPDGNMAEFSIDSENIGREIVENGVANIGYTVVSGDSEIIAEYLHQIISIPLDVIDLDVVYVSLTGNDTNKGTRDSPLATIERALKISSNVVLLEGTYKLGNLGSIYDELSLTGDGNVIIDLDNDGQFLFVGSTGDVTLENLVLVNGYTTATSEDSGAIVGNSGKLTIINCTLANSTSEANGGAIYNVGELSIINSTIANNTAKLGGAIYADKYMGSESVVIINSTFDNNLAQGSGNKAGGAIYAQAFTGEFTITNTTFVNNKAGAGYAGGAIYALQVGDVKIDGSSFINNSADPTESYGGGAITFMGANFNKQGTLTITNSLFEDNKASVNGAAIYIRSSTLDIANSVLINNEDDNGYAIYRHDTSYVTATVTANDNWWGSNDNPKSYINKGTLNRWAILTIDNDTAIAEGNTVKLTVSINNYTDGTVNGTLTKPINVARPVVISTTFGDIEGVLENGEFVYDYEIPSGLRFISATVDDETQVLYVVSSQANVEIDDIVAKKFEKVNVTINVTSEGYVINVGNVELYLGDDLIATIPVLDGKASQEILITMDDGEYNLTAVFIDETQQFVAGEANATLTVDGAVELTNDTFFIFFSEEGILRPEITVNELIFHGNFSGLGVNVITINRPIAIGGDNAVLHDMAYKIISDDVILADVSLIADGTEFNENNGAVIFVDNAADVTLENINIDYNTPSDVNAYAVYANKATGFKLLDSTVLFDANNVGKQVLQHGIEIRDCEDVLVKGNVINGSLPSSDVSWTGSGINKDYPLLIGIQNGEDIVLTENEININTESGSGSFPTLDGIMADGFKNLNISRNNITHVDFSGEGKAGYIYTIDLYNFEQAVIEYNNIFVNTTTGVEAAGTAYPIQITDPFSELLIDHNNLTSLSKGPNIGIFATHYNGGDAEAVISNNFINVTGYATRNDWALVSGIEFEGSYGAIYNNTIYVQSITPYSDSNSLYGISFAQVMGNPREYDIKDNTIYSEGKYAIYIGKAANSYITENTLYGHELTGDDAAVAVGDNNIIENNYPRTPSSIIVEATDVFEGQPTTVTVTIPDATGNVTIRINNKEYVVDLTDGVAVKEIDDYGDNLTVSVTYNGDVRFFPVSNSTTFKVLGNVVTNDTFYSYFDENGNLRSIVPFDELIFKGEFSNLSDYITIEDALTITGEDAVLYDIGFIVSGEDIALDNMTLIANSNLGDLIGVYYSDGVTLSNLNVSYIIDEPGNAIHVFSSDNVYLLDNTVYFESTVDDYAADEMTNAICIDTELDIVDVMMGDIDYISNIVVDNNNITAVIPAFLADSYEHEYYVMGLSAVNGVRINGVEDLEFTNNNIDVTTNYLYRTTPTYQAVYIAASTGLVDGNNISMIDTFTPEGKDVYLHGIVVLYDEDLTISNNNIDLATAGGKADAGSAYPIIAMGSEFTLEFNNITTVSNGPNIGVYFPSRMASPCEAVIRNNIIDVTGLSTTKYTGLVTGIEVQSGDVEIRDNFIYTYNVGDYNESNTIYGISYAQDGSLSDLVIVNNTVITEGHYAVSFLEAEDAVVTDNYLLSEDLFGDSAVFIEEGSDNTVKNNRPYVSNLTVSVENIIVGEDAVVEVSLNANATGTVRVIVNGKTYVVDNIVDGKGSVAIPELAASTYAVSAVFESDSVDYVDDDAQTEFTVSKKESNMTVNIPTDISPGDDVVVEITIPNATGFVTVIVDGKENVVNLKDGNGNFTIENITAGSHNIVSVYNGDDNNDPAYDTTSFEIAKIKNDLIIEVPADIKAGESPVVNITIGNVNGSVIVVVDGKDQTVTLNNGKANVTIENITAGSHSIVAIYNGDVNNEHAVNSTSFKADKTATSISLEIEDGLFVGDSTVIKAYINATGNVSFIIDGVAESAPIIGGVASLELNDLSAGEFDVVAIFTENDIYLGSVDSGMLKVAKFNSTISASADPIESGENATVVVTLPSDAGGKVVIDGKYVADVIGGVANVVVPGLTQNTTLTVVYEGDDKYLGNETTVDVAVSKVSEYNMTVESSSDDGKTIVDVELPEDATGNVTVVTPNGNTTVPVDGGKATVVIPDLPAGENTVNVTYSGDEKYDPKATTETVNTTKKNSILTGDKLEMYVGDGSKFTVVLKDSDGKPISGKGIKITIVGKTYTIKTDASGAAVLPINLKAGSYQVTAVFNGDSEYEASNVVSTSVEVYTKTRITENKDLVKKEGGSEKFTVRALDKYGKPVGAYAKVKMTIAGKTYTVNTDANGYASLAINLKAGTYQITTVYGGTTVTNKITINKK